MTNHYAQVFRIVLYKKLLKFNVYVLYKGQIVQPYHHLNLCLNDVEVEACEIHTQER